MAILRRRHEQRAVSFGLAKADRSTGNPPETYGFLQCIRLAPAYEHRAKNSAEEPALPGEKRTPRRAFGHKAERCASAPPSAAGST